MHAARACTPAHARMHTCVAAQAAASDIARKLDTAWEEFENIGDRPDDFECDECRQAYRDKRRSQDDSSGDEDEDEDEGYLDECVHWQRGAANIDELLAAVCQHARGVTKMPTWFAPCHPKRRRPTLLRSRCTSRLSRPAQWSSSGPLTRLLRSRSRRLSAIRARST